MKPPAMTTLPSGCIANDDTNPDLSSSPELKFRSRAPVSDKRATSLRAVPLKEPKLPVIRTLPSGCKASEKMLKSAPEPVDRNVESTEPSVFNLARRFREVLLTEVKLPPITILPSACKANVNTEEPATPDGPSRTGANSESSVPS